MGQPHAMTDVDVLARTLWGEARGQGMDGMAAVANCIANRVHADLHADGKPDWWGEGWQGVCLAPWQFSCWNANDPNRAKMLALTDADAAYADARVIACGAVAGTLRDRTGGATHYYAPKIVAEPTWAKGRTPTAVLGGHRFYRLLD